MVIGAMFSGLRSHFSTGRYTDKNKAVPFKTFTFQKVAKVGKNTLFQEAESKRNTDFLVPGALAYESTPNTSQILIPKKRLKSHPYLCLHVKEI